MANAAARGPQNQPHFRKQRDLRGRAERRLGAPPLRLLAGHRIDVSREIPQLSRCK